MKLPTSSQPQKNIPYYQEFIEKQGYKFETYQIPIRDGYINTCWRIPSKKNNETNKIPIILQHGLTDSSWTFFHQRQPNLSLPFFLVDNGYDVWLPNNRGNEFSLNHTTLNSSDHFSAYWNFSMEDMARYEIDSNVLYIKNATGLKPEDKIDYIGHSQGTTTFFMKYLEDPEFCKAHIKHYASLGTAIGLKYNLSPFFKLFYQLEKDFRELIPIEDIMTPPIVHYLFEQLAIRAPKVVRTIVDGTTGIRPSGKTDYKNASAFFKYYPGGTSKKNLLHWFQFMKNGTLRRFDYGKEKNLEYYQSEFPPQYNYTNVKTWGVKMFLTISDNDAFCPKENVDEIYNMIEDKSIVYKVELKGYNHMDGNSAADSPTEIFKPLVEFLKNF